MLKYIFPVISKEDILPILKMALLGGLIAGCYGIIHDQITFTISPEYFTKLKFKQFALADFGFNERVFAGLIGFLATIGAGFLIGWFLGRRLIPGQEQNIAHRNTIKGFLTVFVSAVFFGVGGFIYGLYAEAHYEIDNWLPVLYEHDVQDQWAFVKVAYTHNASYIGGLIGFIIAFIYIKPGEKQ